MFTAYAYTRAIDRRSILVRMRTRGKYIPANEVRHVTLGAILQKLVARGNLCSKTSRFHSRSSNKKAILVKYVWTW